MLTSSQAFSLSTWYIHSFQDFEKGVEPFPQGIQHRIEKLLCPLPRSFETTLLESTFAGIACDPLSELPRNNKQTGGGFRGAGSTLHTRGQDNMVDAAAPFDNLCSQAFPPNDHANQPLNVYSNDFQFKLFPHYYFQFQC